MNRLASSALLSAALLAVPMKAGEVGLLIDKQFGSSQTVGALHIDAPNPSGFGLRGAFTAVDLKVAEFGISATWHPETSVNLDTNFGQLGKFKHDYIAIGGQFDWKLAANFHAGLELRQETMHIEVSNERTKSTKATRPWVNVGVGLSFPAPVVKPFVRLEAAFALKTYESASSALNEDDLNKSFAPKYQIGIYGGIRF